MERPILFSAPMVRALLAGTKTQTRRVAKLKPREAGYNLGFTGVEAGFYCSNLQSSGWVLRSRGAGSCWNDRTFPAFCRYGVPGDRLWVRETWCPRISHSHAADACDCADLNVTYAADGKVQLFDDGDVPHEWTMPKAANRGDVSPLFMPRWASRITLEVTGVQLERLRSISSADACAEGCVEVGLGARANFEALWKSINGEDSWDANPWVWAISFRPAAQPGDQGEATKP